MRPRYRYELRADCGTRLAAITEMLRPTYPLETNRLLLRPYTADDLDSSHDIAGREDVNRYLYSEPKDRDQTEWHERLARQVM